MLIQKKGILVVSGKNKKFTLPGGGAEKYESRRKAAIRELKEETGLISIKSKYLFKYKGKEWHDFHGKSIKNSAKVFKIETIGKAKPKHEIKYISYWTPKSKIKITEGTKRLINKYLNENIIK